MPWLAQQNILDPVADQPIDQITDLARTAVQVAAGLDMQDLQSYRAVAKQQNTVTVSSIALTLFAEGQCRVGMRSGPYPDRQVRPSSNANSGQRYRRSKLPVWL